MKKFLALFALFGLVLSALPLGNAVLAFADGHSHHYEQEVITRQPTCTEAGEGYLVCPEDGAKTKPIAIPALGHHLVKKTVEPTCTKQGYDVTYCTRCGEEKEKTNFVEALGHDFHTYEIPSGCSHPGHIESYCSRCGVDEYEPHDTPAQGHDYVLFKTIEPNCLDVGYDIFKCSKCGRLHYTNVVSPLGHHYVDKVVEPTCTEGGHSEHECDRCGDFFIDSETAPLGHDYVTHEEILPTCTGEGRCQYEECTRCGEKVGYCPLDPLGHLYERSYVVSPTCLEEGYTMYECRYCHATKKGDIIPALGHDLIHHDAKAPDCTEGWEAYDTCSRCDYSTLEIIPPINEDHLFETEVIPATTSSKGYTRHVCSLCGYSYIDSETAPLEPSREEAALESIEHGHAPIEDPGRIVVGHSDDDSYFYLIYLGTILDMPLHTYVSFQFDPGTKSLDALPRSISVPAAMDVKELYEQKTNILASNAVNILASSPLIEGVEQVARSNDPSLDKVLNDTFPSVFGSNPCREYADPDFALFVEKARSIACSYDRDKTDAYEVGNVYSYNLVGDVHCFVGAVYDKISKTFSYRVLSQLGSVSEKVFMLPSGSSTVHEGLTPLPAPDYVSIGLIEPSSYATNHPLLEKTFSHPDHVQINYNTTWPYDCIDSNMPSYKDKGYDCVHLEFTWNWDRANGKPICFRILVSDTKVLTGFDDSRYNSSGAYQGWWTYDTPDQKVSWAEDYTIDHFSVYNGLKAQWRNGGTSILSVLAQGVKDITVKFVYYNSFARSKGAYNYYFG